MKKQDLEQAFEHIIFFVVIFFMLVGCLGCGSTSTVTNKKIVRDTVYVKDIRTDTVLIDRMNEIDSLIKALKQSQDSTKFYRDSVYYQNYINSRRIEKIKYYIKICDKNTKNKKYFFGWIKRTMTE